ncbi:MAG: ADP-glyceromanno-heptose 6-epimerase [Pantoea sp. Brub]|nr:ADP-glyceromanno-heptose 6-epimerase [Pantoea sp. Brub]
MIIVTGGAGFIGSNLIKKLNNLGETNILLVDDLKNSIKFKNLVDLNFYDFIDKEYFLHKFILNTNLNLGIIDAVFHEGACSDTTEWNGKYIINNNYQYSKELLNFCLKQKIPFVYASSASVYGIRDSNFIEDRQYEKPVNLYAYSKMLFDNYVRQLLPKATSPICGLRYFNVYGPYENHKKNMASLVLKLINDSINNQNLKLFQGSENFKRDFIYVNDVVALNIWCLENNIFGIYNCGTGCSESLVTLANVIIEHYNKGTIEYIPFPKQLEGYYQYYTQANLNNLKKIGYNKPFININQGITKYINWINNRL